MKVLVILTGIEKREEAELIFSSLSPDASWAEKAIILPPGKYLEIPVRRYISEYAEGTETISRLLAETSADYVLWMDARKIESVSPEAIECCLSSAQESGASLVYADYSDHPVNDYELGSVRNNFDFGPFLFLDRARLEEVLKVRKASYRYAGLYDLRLGLSRRGTILHLREPLGKKKMGNDYEKDKFSYLDPAHEAYEREMELALTAHLKEINAYLPPRFFPLPDDDTSYPVEVSVVIPVKNRMSTIREAVKSALAQKTRFSLNVIVVDNHSTDGTSRILDELRGQHENLVILRPERADLNIGGCWNLAVRSPFCGRFSVQLDSDDVYEHEQAVEKMVDMLRSGDYAMVVGSYTLVNGKGEILPPGIITHREWTEENGRNNALRVEGFGAPRAFRTGILRKNPFPNVSYGEDYALGLRISRFYRIGRIFESLYLCCRWEGNSDTQLTWEKINLFHAYKDRLRTVEIMARKRMNEGAL